VSKVELHLDYEGFTTECMAIGAMQDFAFHLSVHPATLALTASLGNLVAEYGALPPGHPNRTILTMREGTSGSLIDVEFK
jgi:vacuolar protein sorting-associated protein 13A/C